MIFETTAHPLPYWHRQALALGKEAAAGLVSYDLSGLLYVAKGQDGRDWALLSAPAALVRGAFDALSAPGIELPLRDGRLQAAVAVILPDELALVGGAEALANDRGKAFRYALGRLVEFAPDATLDASRAWAFRVHSPELQMLRRSHGLSSLPRNGEWDFDLLVAVRRKGVLGRTDTAKATTAA